jgi:hypothetical protein
MIYQDFGRTDLIMGRVSNYYSSRIVVRVPYCTRPHGNGTHSTLFVRAPYSKPSGRQQRPVPPLHANCLCVVNQSQRPISPFPARSVNSSEV